MKLDYLKGGNIITLDTARRARKFAAIAQVEAYWMALRNGRLMPSRSEIDPRGIANHLSNAFVLEQIAPGLARIRLAGQHLTDVLSMEVRGMPITAFFMPEARAEIQSALESVFETPATVSLSLIGKGGMLSSKLEAQMIIMPLKDDEGHVTRAFGALQVIGKMGRGPHRFTIRSMEITPLRTDQTTPFRPSGDKSFSADTDLETVHEDQPHCETSKVTRVDLRKSKNEDLEIHDLKSGHVVCDRSDNIQLGFAEPQGFFKPRATENPMPNELAKSSRPVVRGHLRLVKKDDAP